MSMAAMQVKAWLEGERDSGVTVQGRCNAAAACIHQCRIEVPSALTAGDIHPLLQPLRCPPLPPSPVSSPLPFANNSLPVFPWPCLPYLPLEKMLQAWSSHLHGQQCCKGAF